MHKNARSTDPYWKNLQRDIQGLLSSAVWYRFPLNQKSRSWAGLFSVKDRGTVCFLTVAPFKINGLMKTVCLHRKPRSISVSITSIILLHWQGNPDVTAQCACVCVFSLATYIDYQSMHSTSRAKTFRLVLTQDSWKVRTWFWGLGLVGIISFSVKGWEMFDVEENLCKWKYKDFCVCMYILCVCGCVRARTSMIGPQWMWFVSSGTKHIVTNCEAAFA